MPPVPPYGPGYAPVYLSPKPNSLEKPLPGGSQPWPIPTFELRAEDLANPGANIFFSSVSPGDLLKAAVVTVCSSLYTPDNLPFNVCSILLVLRAGMTVPAYTTGSATHKEIHLNLEHVRNSASRARDEIVGIITHEMVHCYQYDAKGTCPGGLIEGIADWVRLRAGLAPPHWKEGRGEKWDAGYDATAYFLDWIDGRFGVGTVQKLNGQMKDKEYDVDMFMDLTGHKVKELWKMYRDYLKTLPDKT